jgi:hypothetical protein
MQRPAFPTLFDPVITSDSAFVCWRSFGGLSTAATRLKTTMSGEALLDHYARQLQDSGWAPERNLPASVGRTWTRRDSTGAIVQVALKASTSLQDSTCHEVTLEVQTPRKP